MSLYLPTLNALFVHVPRCAGTWVKRVLVASDVPWRPAAGGGDHNLPDAYDHPGARRFCFVRHPAAWVESAWRGLHGSWPQRRDVLPLHAERTWGPTRLLTYLAGERDFGAFVEALLAEQPGFVTRLFEWYAGPPGRPRVDCVGRAEFAAADLAAILRSLGWAGELATPRAQNESEAPRPVWPPGLYRRFLDAEAAALARWYPPGLPGPFFVTRD